MSPRTAKDVMLPHASPPTRQKLATVAAVSTSSLRPFRFGFLSTFGAAIIQSVLNQPLVRPNTIIRIKKPASGMEPVETEELDA
jgi:hypothetical protein